MQLAITVGVAAACAALCVPRATYYRHLVPRVKRPKAQPTPARALPVPERQGVLALLNSERFADQAPRQVYAQLLDEGSYVCSPRTMYRILADAGEVRERRDQLRHPVYAKPELLATAPNQVWSWDISKLKGPQKWVYYYLYVVIDVFSRYVTGWMIASRETAVLGQDLIAAACERQGITPGHLTIHADRGAQMTAKSTALLFADLGIIKSHSRPYVSDDNPYSEAAFKTLKYRPEVPDYFGSIQHARQQFVPLLDWYNNQHYHSNLALLTPADVHYGRHNQVIAKRQVALDVAFQKHPERFVHGKSVHPQPPKEAWINKPSQVPLH